MAINQFEIESFLEVARERVTEQFKGKPVFDKYIQLLLGGFADLQEVARQLQQERSIDTAVGAQLDVIGDIVGRPRGLVTATVFQYHGFEGEPLAGTFGSLTDGTVGAPWYSLGAPLGISRPPSDEEYRLILKAKIIKNRTFATPEDVIAAYKFMFGTSTVYITEPESGKASIGIGKILSAVERGLLFDLGGVGSLLPKTIGVEYTYSEFNAGRVFATMGFVGGMGVGDINDTSVGGFLTNIIT